MKSVVAICLLLAVASATFKDSHTILAEIDQHHFGNTMLSMVQVNMAAKAPADEIMGLIDTIIDQLETEAREEGKTYAANKADCDQMIPQLEFAIADTKMNIARLEKTIEENEAILAQAKTDLRQAEADYDETVNAIEVGTAERQAAHEKWANEDYDMTIQITTLDEGVKLINHMLHGVAFSQVSTRYEKVVDTLKNQKTRHSSLFQPLVTQLTQLATKLNYDNVMNILDLLSSIRQSISQAQQEARADEEAAQAQWEADLKVLEAMKKALAEKRARLEALIASTTKYLAECRKSLEMARVNLENYQVQLADKIEQCDAWTAAHEAYVDESDRELDILNQLRDHLIEKGQQIGEYVKNRMANAPAY